MRRLCLVCANTGSTITFRRNTNRVELALGRLNHRLQVPEVRGACAHLGGEHDLLLVHDGLGVVALRVAARGLHVARVRIGRVDLPRGDLGRLIWLRWATEPSASSTSRAAPTAAGTTTSPWSRSRTPSHPGAKTLPSSHGGSLTLVGIVRALQALLACWQDTCPTCRRELPARPPPTHHHPNGALLGTAWQGSAGRSTVTSS
jgi:hypothetical protein